MSDYISILKVEIEEVTFEILVFRWVNTSELVIDDTERIIIGDVDVAQMCRVLKNSVTLYDVRDGVQGMWYDLHITRAINYIMDGN